MTAESLPPPVAAPPSTAATAHTPSTLSLSPNQRAWARFRRNRLGFVSMIVFGAMLLVSTFAELVSNDRPLVASYQGQLYFPIVNNKPESTFDGDFQTPTEWADPLIREGFSRPGVSVSVTVPV